MPRHVVFFVYPGFVLLDLSGPLEALALAEDMSPGSYRFTVVSLEGGPIKSSSGVSVHSEPVSTRATDTLIVVGTPAMPRRALVRRSSDFIRKASLGARRTASVCTGAFLLAASGLLDGRRATTHWRYAPQLKTMYPASASMETAFF